jgi:hypothetical protein
MFFFLCPRSEIITCLSQKTQILKTLENYTLACLAGETEQVGKDARAPSIPLKIRHCKITHRWAPVCLKTSQSGATPET